MKFPKPMTLVVSGTEEEFVEYAKDKDLLFTRRVRKASDLEGLRGCVVEYVGTYQDNPLFGSPALEEVKCS